MKKFFKAACLLCCLTTSGIYAQVGMNSNTPNPNATLDLNNTDGKNDKGLLLPKVELSSTTSASPMTAHVEGMKVYNTFTSVAGANQVTPGEYYNDGTKWVRITSSADGNNNWTLGGNTNGALKELGTKDAQPLPFITNGTAKMSLSTTGALSLGGNNNVNPNFIFDPGLQADMGFLRLMTDKFGNSNAHGISISQFQEPYFSNDNGLNIIRGRGSHASPKLAEIGDRIGTIQWSTFNPSAIIKMQPLIKMTTYYAGSKSDGSATIGQLHISSNTNNGILVDNGIALGKVYAPDFYNALPITVIPSTAGAQRDPANTKVDVFLVGIIGSNFRVATSAATAVIDDIDNKTSLYINNANSTLNYTLKKADATNVGAMFTFVASGGGTSGKVTITAASGDKIAVIGGATTTTATSNAIKVISNGKDTWYQIP
ncbi:hypothetical protein [Flavobacterium panacagri]|uniref:hypothetical protein n=1 Tax=Flavobacterium panacagri TaxID=3034146 RepID=UPI0025A64AE2|nr:hypothetical protein [Flavobacterium panacagri]